MLFTLLYSVTSVEIVIPVARIVSHTTWLLLLQIHCTPYFTKHHSKAFIVLLGFFYYFPAFFQCKKNIVLSQGTTASQGLGQDIWKSVLVFTMTIIGIEMVAMVIMQHVLFVRLFHAWLRKSWCERSPWRSLTNFQYTIHIIQKHRKLLLECNMGL